MVKKQVEIKDKDGNIKIVERLVTDDEMDNPNVEYLEKQVIVKQIKRTTASGQQQVIEE